MATWKDPKAQAKEILERREQNREAFANWVDKVYGPPAMAGGSLNHFVHTLKGMGWNMAKESDRDDFEQQVKDTLFLARKAAMEGEQ